MNKITQKRNKYNTDVLNEIGKKYAITSRYVRQCITGDRVGIFPDKIKAEYKTIELKMRTTLENEINKQ